MTDAVPDARPLVHLTPETGWVNDPLGLTWTGGRWHLFTQFVPHQVEWAAACHWAHAVSEDLLRWSHRPVALAPGDGDGGVWSGSVVLPRDTGADEPGPQLFYTAVDVEDVTVGRVRVATPVDDSWDRWAKGPVVAQLPPGVEVAAFRDPFVLHDGTTWRMVLGGGLTDGTAVAWTWTSPDRRAWTFAGELVRRATTERDPVWTGAGWECPVLVPLDGRWVLVMSVWEPGALHWVGYGVGDLVDGRFVATAWGRLGYGPSYYAPSTFRDREGRPGLVHWLRGVQDPDGRWAGAASVPQVLTLRGNRLVARPHPVATGGTVVGTAREGSPAAVPEAAWLTWSRGSALTVTSGGVPLLRLTREGDILVVADDVRHFVPLDGGDEVGILVDRLVVEVFTDGGILAVPVPPAADLAVEPSGPGQVVVRQVG